MLVGPLSGPDNWLWLASRRRSRSATGLDDNLTHETPLVDAAYMKETIELAGRQIEIGSFHLIGPPIQLPTEPERIESRISALLGEKLVAKGLAETPPVMVGLSKWRDGDHRIAVATLASGRLPNSSASHSRLTLCWLVADLHQPVLGMIRDALNDIDWDTQSTEWNAAP